MARTVRNHPVPRDKMQEERGAEQIPEVKTQEISVGLYIRLSKEDSGKHNQNTVENQKALLEDFVRSKADMKVFDVYIDNGFSGTNFERPAFQKMMEDAKSGKINCIIVKDLSRFGRSYLEIGNYLEKIFPFLNIRFISVTDHFDTFAAASSESGRPLTNGLEIPLKNIINEVYAKDISRKVGSAIEIKKKEGRYGGGVAPYGYRKSKTVKGKYEVDEEAAKVVRYIFGLRSEGYGYCSIVKILNEKEIKSPSAYRYEKGIVKNEKLRDVLWKAYAIEDMLRDEVYLGNMVRGKTHSAMHKGEKRHPVPREEWIVVPGMHKPIVSKELFDAVQAVNEKRAQEHKKKLEKAKENPKRDNVFKGKIFCGDCGITMGCSVGKHNSKSWGTTKIQRCHLENVKFTNSCLDRIKLRKETINNSEFINCSLKKADLERCNVQESIFGECVLDEIILIGAELCNIEITKTSCRNANLSNSSIEDSQLISIDFENTSFTQAILKKNSWEHMKFRNSDFRHTQIFTDDFIKLKKYDADLRWSVEKNEDF